MVTLRHLLRALAVAGPLAVLAAPPAASAAGLPVPSTTAPATSVPATTVAPTTVPPSTTTTAPPAPVAPAPSSAPGKTPPATGIPSVPTGGPPTTAPAPGAPPAAPVDVGPSVAAVDADLAQLTAINAYGQVKAAVGTAQQQLAAATDALAAARAQAGAIDARHDVAATRVAEARGHMAHLALAAYTGEAYAQPGSPQALSPAGTVSTIGGRSADQAAEADVLLGVVVEQTQQLFDAARTVLRHADADSARAQAMVAAAQGTVTAATAGVTAAQHALLIATRAATVAGAATLQAARPAGAPATQLASTSTRQVALSPNIVGPSMASAPELAAWYASTGHQANTTAPIAQLAADYATAGAQTGVAADLAFAQSIIETGFFAFPAGGQLTPADNNFAGIGACDSCSHGWSFPDALTGVTAQLQLLEAYASPTKVATPLIGPVGVGGCCATWVALAGKWASSTMYGVEIMTVYKQILDWVIPQRLLAAGLAAPGSVVPAPPGTEASGPAGPPPAGAVGAPPPVPASTAPAAAPAAKS